MKRLLILIFSLVLITACDNTQIDTESAEVNNGTGSIVEQKGTSSSGALLDAEVIDTCKDFIGDEQDHCYQQKAWEQEDFMICRKISGDRFEYTGGNPPRDKCFSMVALKKCDPSICDFIQGGQRYFSPTECLDRIYKNCSK
ncbi:MAG: hypothetical protein K9M03_04125 [Kiritimatiellales bacterium]|nr:hypothetical protein [Kiritimatiellales bacterium]